MHCTISSGPIQERTPQMETRSIAQVSLVLIATRVQLLQRGRCAPSKKPENQQKQDYETGGKQTEFHS